MSGFGATGDKKLGWVRMTTVQVSGAIETPAAHFAFEGSLRAGTHLTVYDLRSEGRGGAIWKWPTQAGESEQFSIVLEQEGESLFGRLVIEAITKDERLFRIEAHPPPGRAVSRQERSQSSSESPAPPACTGRSPVPRS